MSEKNNFLYDVSMSYVNAGWQERYCALVKYLDAYLKENCGEFFADLQLLPDQADELCSSGGVL